MNGTKRVRWWAAVALFATACAGSGGGGGEAYRVGGDPWATPPAAAKSGGEAARPAGEPANAANSASASKGTDGAPSGAAAPAPMLGQGTTLEQLDAATARNQTLEGENQALTAQVASLNAVIEQLRRDNAGLSQLVQAGTESQAGVNGEIEKLRGQVKDFELRSRQLADDLLAERIKRVRVERQLILAKVTEAESQGDGP